jgi:hypothetical protein
MISILPKNDVQRERWALHAHASHASRVTTRASAPDAVPDDARLFELQLACNLFPAEYVHASWLETPGWSLCRGGDAGRSEFWIRYCSATLLRERGLDLQFDWDFSDRGKRLALLDGSTLLRLGQLASAVLMRDSLRSLVCRDEVQAIQEVLGSEAHLYAVRWRGPVPTLDERLRCTFGSHESTIDPVAYGRQCACLLMAAIPAGAAGVRGRLQLKLPRCWADECAYGVRLAEAQRDGLVRLFVAIIADAYPQRLWLFGSQSGMASASPSIPQEAPC